jgi:hypothetical protein
MEEVWKNIEGCGALYQVSNFGRIKSFVRGRPKIIKGIFSEKNGYLKVKLIFENGEKKYKFIHRIVAYHFCNGYQRGLVVDHLDGNKLNNKSTNLEWVTYSVNNKRAYDLGLKKWNPTPSMIKALEENHNKNSKKITAILPNGQKLFFPSGYAAGRYFGMRGESIMDTIKRNRPNRQGVWFELTEK